MKLLIVGRNIFMKLTKDMLMNLIVEELSHGVKSCAEVHPGQTHKEWKEPKKLNETKPETPISEDDSSREDCVPKSELRDVLKTWMEKEYDSDEDRWREYGKDIQELVGDELKEG